MPAIGTVRRTETGFEGQLKTLSIQAAISIVRNTTKSADGQPDYKVFTTGDIEIGAGWIRTARSSGAPYVSLSLAAPEFGPRRPSSPPPPTPSGGRISCTGCSPGPWTRPPPEGGLCLLLSLQPRLDVLAAGACPSAIAARGGSQEQQNRNVQGVKLIRKGECGDGRAAPRK